MADEIVQPELVSKVHDQLIAIRDSGETNMFDFQRVLKLAKELKYHALVGWLTRVSAETYCTGILYGFKVLD